MVSAIPTEMAALGELGKALVTVALADAVDDPTLETRGTEELLATLVT